MKIPAYRRDGEFRIDKQVVDQFAGNFIIAIDGPSGSGKSTVTRLVASKLGISYLDSGAFYRACTVRLLRDGVDLRDRDRIKEILNGTKIDAVAKQDGSATFLNGEDVSTEIRSDEVTANVSRVSEIGVVRDLVTRQLRNRALNQSLVVEGRDIGTVVFPGSALKIYLSASAAARAERRNEEMVGTGRESNVEEIRRGLEKRDNHDSHRLLAPLHKAEDAVLLDTTDMSIEEVVSLVVNKANEMIADKR